MKTLRNLKIDLKECLTEEELLKLKGGVDGTMCLQCLDILSEYIGGTYTICGIGYDTGMIICRAYYPETEHWIGQCNVNCPQ